MARKSTPRHLPKDLEGELDLASMIAGNHQKYLVINLLADRSRELNDGARPLVEIEGPHTYLELSVAEGASGLLKILKKEKQKTAEDVAENS